MQTLALKQWRREVGQKEVEDIQRRSCFHANRLHKASDETMDDLFKNHDDRRKYFRHVCLMGTVGSFQWGRMPWTRTPIRATLQNFANNGLCLQYDVRKHNPVDFFRMRNNECLRFKLKLPVSNKRVVLSGKLSWHRYDKESSSYIIGVEFQEPVLNRIFLQVKDYLSKSFLILSALRLPKCPRVHSIQSRDFSDYLYRKQYEAYLKHHHIGSHEHKMNVEYWAHFNNARVYKVGEGANENGVISIVGNALCGLPCESIFPNTVHRLKNMHAHPLEEINLLSIDNGGSRKVKHTLNYPSLSMTSHLLRVILHHYSRGKDMSTILVVCGPKERRMFELIGFKCIASHGEAEAFVSKPAVLMRLNGQQLLDRIRFIQNHKLLDVWFKRCEWPVMTHQPA